jgi:chromosome segregation ATPase
MFSKTAELDEEEIQNLKGQIGELRNRLSAVQNQLDQNRIVLEEYEAKEKELHDSMTAQKVAFKEKLESQVTSVL